MDQIKKLNKQLKKIFPDGKVHLKPIQFLDVESSVTQFSPKDDAFNLKQPVVGGIRETTPPTEINPNGGVYRGIIGLMTATDPQRFLFSVFALINQGLNQLTQELGDLTGRDIIIERPGLKGEFLCLMERCAGLELRLCILPLKNER